MEDIDLSNELELEFNNSDMVILHNLKTEKYNDLEALVICYDRDKTRYKVRLTLDNDIVEILVKQENLKLKVIDNTPPIID